MLIKRKGALEVVIHKIPLYQWQPQNEQMTTPKTPRKRTVQSVERALDILDLFSEQQQELTLHQIYTSLNLNKNTAYGLIYTLCQKKYLDKNFVNKKYILGSALLSKVHINYDIHTTSIVKKYMPVLQELVDRFNMTGNLFVYRENTLTGLKMIMPQHYGFMVNLDESMDFHCSASGKLALSYWTKEQIEEYFELNQMKQYTSKTITTIPQLQSELESIRIQGYSVENEEIVMGIYSVAVPICDPNHFLIGTMSLTGPVCSETQRFTVIEALKEAVDNFSQHSSKSSK